MAHDILSKLGSPTFGVFMVLAGAARFRPFLCVFSFENARKVKFRTVSSVRRLWVGQHGSQVSTRTQKPSCGP